MKPRALQMQRQDGRPGTARAETPRRNERLIVRMHGGVTQRRKQMTIPFIETFTGAAFQPTAPRLEDVWIEDIAHALSNQCRFSGHVRDFYSVAEHSLRVSWALEEWGEDQDVQLWGLLHDASEAYLVDLPTPIKHSEIGAEYRKAETALMRTICQRFAISIFEPASVRVADGVLLATEVRDLMPNKKEHWSLLMLRPLEQQIQAMPPKTAEALFLTRFRKLNNQR